MRKKFVVIDAETGHKVKLLDKEMVVMNSQGVFFIIGNVNDWEPYVEKLSSRVKKYDVVWLDGDYLE